MIKFSVITVCLNAGNDLLETIKSTLEQTYANFEIIVKDGGSTDGVLEKIPKDNRIRIIQEKDSGIYDAMNQGIEAATGAYMVFMNAGDQFYSSNVLESVANKIGNRNADLYYGRCYNRILNVVDPAPIRLTKYFCYRSMICHQATFYSSEMLKRRGYDTSYKVSADRERMLYAVINEHIKSEFIPTIIVSFQGGGFCTTPKAESMLKMEQKRLKKMYFTGAERIKFGALHAITLPTIRRKLIENKKIKRLYRIIVSKLYGN